MQKIIDDNMLILNQLDNFLIVKKLTNKKEMKIRGLEIPNCYHDWMLIVHFCGAAFFD